MNFADFLTARRRGIILQALEAVAPGTTVAADLLHRFCLSVGLRPTRESVDKDLRWLAERHLVEVGESNGLMMASITQAGREVATQRATAAGVDVSENAG